MHESIKSIFVIVHIDDINYSVLLMQIFLNSFIAQPVFKATIMPAVINGSRDTAESLSINRKTVPLLYSSKTVVKFLPPLCFMNFTGFYLRFYVFLMCFVVAYWTDLQVCCRNAGQVVNMKC